MALTKYNSYDYEKDRFKMYPPKALLAIQRADAEIEADYDQDPKLDAADREKRWAIEHAELRRQSYFRCTARRNAGIPPDPKKSHPNAGRKPIYTPEQRIERNRERQRLRHAEHRDEDNARARQKRAAKKAAQQGGPQ